MIRRMAAICLALALVGQATASFGAGNAQESTGTDAGARVGSVVGTAAYIPFKTVFCVLGGTGSGLAYLFANQEFLCLFRAPGSWGHGSQRDAHILKSPILSSHNRGNRDDRQGESISAP